VQFEFSLLTSRGLKEEDGSLKATAFKATSTDVRTNSREKSLKRRKRFLLLSLFAGLIIGFAVTTVEARPWAIDRFYGTFEGVSNNKLEGEISSRDLEVKIRPGDDGFVVDWSALMKKADGRVKRTKYSIAFKPTHRENIYQSMMRTDLFGHMVPLDPMRGDPFVWATVDENTLVIYALLIAVSGAQDLQIYRRTLTPSGLALDYTRLYDTSPVTRITATLLKVGNRR
jgi:hypothetical protein